MTLSPKLYNFFQHLIVGDFSKPIKMLQDVMGFKEGDTIVEIGCGTGLLAPKFVNLGVRYVGLDISNERIETAKQTEPRARFYCVNVANNEINLDIDFRFSIMHGVLHHLNDKEVRDILHFLRQRNCELFAAMEPTRPKQTWSEILGTLYCYLDEGDYIRSMNEYRELFRNDDNLTMESYKWPLLPITNTLICARFGKNKR